MANSVKGELLDGGRAEEAAVPIYTVFSLDKKLMAIQRSVSALVKDEQNNHFKFSYVGIAQTIHAIREKMNELGLRLEVCIDNAQTIPWEGRALVELRPVFVWIDTESGETRSINWYQSAYDAEVGVGKALTYATKYFLWSQFTIPRDDDPDKDYGQSVKNVVESQNIDEIKDLLRRTKTPENKFLAYFGVNSLTSLSNEQRREGVRLLKEKLSMNGGVE